MVVGAGEETGYNWSWLGIHFSIKHNFGALVNFTQAFDVLSEAFIFAKIETYVRVIYFLL